MSNRAPVNILLVDDHPENLVALEAILENPEYNLVSAASGHEALSLLLKQEFAVILLDVLMPDMDGFEVASTIKAREKTRNVPIIFVTAVAREGTEVLRGYSVGAVDYIQKPLDPHIVRSKVAVFVELFRAKEEVKRQDELIRNSERAAFLKREQEARLRAETAEKRYYDLINWVDHAILWEFDPSERVFSFVSERSAEIIGFSSEDWVKDPKFFFERVYKDDLPSVRRVFDDAILRGEDGRAEHRFFNKKGEQVWLHTGVNPRKDKHGNVTLLWGLTLDITPFKSAEENQRLVAKASSIFSSSLDYHVTLEKVAQMAASSISDWCTVDITKGETPTRIVSARGRPDLQERALEIQRKYRPKGVLKSPILRVIATGKAELFHSISDEDLVSFAQNEEHLALMREVGFQSLMIAPLIARGQTFGAITFGACDGRKRYSEKDLEIAEELAWHAAQAIDNARLYGEAQKQVRLRDTILGIVSHDLRSPLTAIRMNLQMVARGGQGDPKVPAQKGLRSADRMDRMIRDLLDFGKIEAGQMKVELSPCDASDIVSEIVELMQPIASAHSISIAHSPCPEGVRISCDRDRLQQVLSNLIGNAIKFSPAGSSIRIGLRMEGEMFEFSVSDSGVGISKEELAHVFEPYWQSQKGRKAEGSGLGLYISKKLIEAHGGRIWIDSEEDKGTTVHFTVPLARSETQEPPQAA